MAGKQEVARVEQAEVPDLVRTPATTIDASDIAIPKLKLGQHSSNVFDTGAVKLGDVYSIINSDDEDPVVLWEYTENIKPGDGVLFHVLHLRKGWSYSEGSGSPLQIWAFDDPNRHEKAWRTYRYTVVLPEVDTQMPYTFMLYRSGQPAAQKINGDIARDQATKPMWTHAFRLTSARRKKEGAGTYAIAQVRSVEANSDHVLLAGDLFSQIADGLAQQDVRASREDPEI